MIIGSEASPTITHYELRITHSILIIVERLVNYYGNGFPQKMENRQI